MAQSEAFEVLAKALDSDEFRPGDNLHNATVSKWKSRALAAEAKVVELKAELVRERSEHQNAENFREEVMDEKETIQRKNLELEAMNVRLREGSGKVRYIEALETALDDIELQAVMLLNRARVATGRPLVEVPMLNCPNDRGDQRGLPSTERGASRSVADRRR